jgi:ubiquitin carboxyl-terminal hydrolase 4/11/15
MIWHHGISKNFFNILASASKWEPKETIEGEAPKSGNIQLTDCLKEFKVTETLDEENMWYCNQCKEHVCATKTMEIFKLPPILIITLKRFKVGRARYMFSSSGVKLDTLVEFPLDNLDMRDFVLCSE